MRQQSKLNRAESNKKAVTKVAELPVTTATAIPVMAARDVVPMLTMLTQMAYLLNLSSSS